MPSADRHWRLAVVATALILLFGCGYVAESVWEVIAFNYGPAEFFADHPIADSLFGIVVYLSVLTWVVRSLRRARARERLRHQVLAGNADIIPLAVVTPNPGDAPDVSSAPLELSWRPLRMLNPFLFVVLPLLGIIVLGMGLMMLLLIVGVRSLAVIFGTAVVVVIPGVWAISRLMDRRVAGKRVERLIASGTGIEWHPQRGPLRQVRWEDALLLEVWSAGQDQKRGTALGYTLFGRSERVEWQVLPASVVAPDGMTFDELALRQRRLLDLIAAKTHLTPRTFVVNLQAPSEQPVRRTRIFAIRLALLYAVLSAIDVLLGALAIALVLLPVTHVTPLNVSVAIALGLAALWLAWLILTEVYDEIKGPPAGVTDYRLPAVPRTAMHVAAGFAYAARWQRRLKFLLFGLALTSAAVPAIISFADLPAHQAAISASLFADLHKAMLAGLIACTLVGLASLWIGLVGGPTYVYGDAQGIHEREKEDAAKLLPWDAILGLTVHAEDGNVRAVAVIGLAEIITWPGPWTHLLPPGQDIQAVSPEELAALVVERSGRQPRIIQDD